MVLQAQWPCPTESRRLPWAQVTGKTRLCASISSAASPHLELGIPRITAGPGRSAGRQSASRRSRTTAQRSAVGAHKRSLRTRRPTEYSDGCSALARRARRPSTLCSQEAWSAQAAALSDGSSHLRTELNARKSHAECVRRARLDQARTDNLSAARVCATGLWRRRQKRSLCEGHCFALRCFFFALCRCGASGSQTRRSLPRVDARATP